MDGALVVCGRRFTSCHSQLCPPSRSGWPAVSSHSPQPHESLDVECLREQVEEIDRGDLVFMSGLWNPSRLTRRLQENTEVAGQRRRVARQVRNLVGPEICEFFCASLLQSGARRVEDYQIRFLRSLL